MNTIAAKFRLYWPLVKGLQSGLLLATGIAGYMSAHTKPNRVAYFYLLVVQRF